MQVVKRDGRVCDFSKERIIKAVYLAMSHTSGGIDMALAEKVTDNVIKKLGDRFQTSVYEIQDLVEN